MNHLLLFFSCVISCSAMRVCVLDNQRSKTLRFFFCSLRNFFLCLLLKILSQISFFLLFCKHYDKQVKVVVFAMILLYFIHLRDYIDLRNKQRQDLFLFFSFFLLLLLLFFFLLIVIIVDFVNTSVILNTIGVYVQVK